jgi:hypothetical protein
VRAPSLLSSTTMGELILMFLSDLRSFFDERWLPSDADLPRLMYS